MALVFLLPHLHRLDGKRIAWYTGGMIELLHRAALPFSNFTTTRKDTGADEHEFAR